MNNKQQEIIRQFKVEYEHKFHLYKMRMSVDLVTNTIVENINNHSKFIFWESLIPGPIKKPLNDLYFELENARTLKIELNTNQTNY